LGIEVILDDGVIRLVDWLGCMLDDAVGLVDSIIVIKLDDLAVGEDILDDVDDIAVEFVEDILGDVDDVSIGFVEDTVSPGSTTK